jgi:hypothetical protein
MTKEPSFAEAVAELAHLSGWNKADVIANPDDAYWEASGYVAKCKWRVIKRGEK